METVSDLLECTICLEFAISPIHNCSKNGHIICGLCIKKVTQCGLCQEALLVPCAFAESIVKKYGCRVPCKNAEFGCNEPIQSSELISHLESCDYKPFVCFLGQKDRCEGQICNMNDFYQHLIQVHLVRTFANERNIFSFLVWLRLNADGQLKPPELKSIKLRGAKKFDEKMFLLFTFEMENFFIWKVVIIGGTTEAKKYQYCVKLHSQTKHGEFTWKGPVMSIQEYEKCNNFPCVNNVSTHLESCANFHLFSLLPFCNKFQKDSEIEYYFQTNIEISKVF